VDRAVGREFRISAPDGRVVVAGTVPSYALPTVKNAAGYYVAPDMDLVDLFIGSDGTLGAIVALDIRLLPVPKVCWGLICFAPTEEGVLDLADTLRDATPRPVALEYFDGHTLNLIRARYADDRRVQTPPPAAGAALYVELMEESDVDAEAAVEAVMTAIESVGMSSDDAWFATDERELKRLRDFRHAVPEAVNAVVDLHRRECPSITKVGTDFSLPADHFRAFLGRQCRDVAAAGLEHVVFGHVGDSHVHLNLLPRTAEERDVAWSLFREWARGVADAGGSVAAEHGLGKLKTELLPLLFGDEAVAEMRRLKRLFDPDERLGRGTLFGTARR
jgi:D-lactate dehydrogenase (cytochrome)